jgi:hypothetical protein
MAYTTESISESEKEVDAAAFMFAKLILDEPYFKVKGKYEAEFEVNGKLVTVMAITEKNNGRLLDNSNCRPGF